jgi:hypothetical protein
MRSFVMLDIETLDTKNTAVILQIGGCIFNRERLVNKFRIDLDWENERANRTISNATLAWWLAQDENVRSDVFYGGQRVAPIDACGSLDYILPADFDSIYSKGSFDFDILENLYKSMGLIAPWNFRQKRDYRTMLKVAEDIYGFKEDKSNSHNAMDDAVNQAENLIKIFRLMKTGVQR